MSDFMAFVGRTSLPVGTKNVRKGGGRPARAGASSVIYVHHKDLFPKELFRREEAQLSYIKSIIDKDRFITPAALRAMLSGIPQEGDTVFANTVHCVPGIVPAETNPVGYDDNGVPLVLGMYHCYGPGSAFVYAERAGDFVYLVPADQAEQMYNGGDFDFFRISAETFARQFSTETDRGRSESGAMGVLEELINSKENFSQLGALVLTRNFGNTPGGKISNVFVRGEVQRALLGGLTAFK